MAGSWSWCTRQQWAASLVPWQPSRGACWLVLDPLCACMTWARRSCCASLSTDGSCPLSAVVHGHICFCSLCTYSMLRGIVGALHSGLKHKTVLNKHGLWLVWCFTPEWRALPAVAMPSLVAAYKRFAIAAAAARLCGHALLCVIGNRVYWGLFFCNNQQ